MFDAFMPAFCYWRWRSSRAGMSNWGSPEGHMGHICVVM